MGKGGRGGGGTPPTQPPIVFGSRIYVIKLCYIPQCLNRTIPMMKEASQEQREAVFERKRIISEIYHTSADVKKEKLKQVLQDMLLDGEKTIVFAHHKVMLDALEELMPEIGMDDVERLVNITEVLDEHSVRVDEDLEDDKLFVYGQQVDDFVFLKKDAIWTVATSALQEVDRQLQVEKARNDALEARILALEKNR